MEKKIEAGVIYKILGTHLGFSSRVGVVQNPIIVYPEP